MVKLLNSFPKNLPTDCRETVHQLKTNSRKNRKEKQNRKTDLKNGQNPNASSKMWWREESELFTLSSIVKLHLKCFVKSYWSSCNFYKALVDQGWPNRYNFIATLRMHFYLKVLDVDRLKAFSMHLGENRCWVLPMIYPRQWKQTWEWILS